jgi:hypothetical protein
MRMTVIGMKFNQAEKKNVACDVISPRGTNPQPRLFETAHDNS